MKRECEISFFLFVKKFSLFFYFYEINSSSQLFQRQRFDEECADFVRHRGTSAGYNYSGKDEK